MKITNKLTLLLLAILSILSVACEDILEKDISNDMVQIIAPQNNAQIESNVVNFQWHALTGADKYRIQVYKEDQTLALDSVVTKTKLDYPLSQGKYQWRIRGENFAYQSAYTLSYNFTVIQTSDLTNQQVILSNPADNLYTNNTAMTLSWSSLDAADSYEFQLINITNGQSLSYQQADLKNTSITINNTILNQDAQYQWKVRAINGTSKTPFNSRTFYIDTVKPNQPQNAAPANNGTITNGQSTTFTWTIPQDSGIIQAPVSYVIEFSQTADFTVISQSSTSTSSSFQQTFNTKGDYYWRVKAIDLAGNIGNYSTIYKFTVN